MSVLPFIVKKDVKCGGYFYFQLKDLTFFIGYRILNSFEIIVALEIHFSVNTKYFLL